ncbi:type II secretion system F family protein [Thermovibrio ammonificans]
MAVFSYRGVNSEGKEVKGVIEAPSYTAAHSLLKSRGIYPYELKEEEVSASEKRLHLPFIRRGPSNQELATFFKTLATLIDAGIPIVEAVESFVEKDTPPHLQLFYSAVAGALKEGATFTEALKRAGLRNETLLSLIYSGEKGALLPENLKLAALLLEKIESLKTKVAQALIYPAILFVVALGVVVFMMTAVIPKIVGIYTTAHLELPLSTRLVILFSNLLLNHYYLIVTLLALSLFAFLLLVKKRRKLFHQLLLKLPLFGNLLYLSSLQRFLYTLGNLLNAGVPVVEALEIAVTTIPNLAVRLSVKPVVEHVKKGESLSKVLSELIPLPLVVYQLLKAGELSGNLGEMALKGAGYLETEIDVKVKSLTSLIEPVTMLIVGLMIGFIVYALLLPIVSISTIKAL